MSSHDLLEKYKTVIYYHTSAFVETMEKNQFQIFSFQFVLDKFNLFNLFFDPVLCP